MIVFKGPSPSCDFSYLLAFDILYLRAPNDATPAVIYEFRQLSASKSAPPPHYCFSHNPFSGVRGTAALAELDWRAQTINTRADSKTRYSENQ